jgi:hypothetical protein
MSDSVLKVDVFSVEVADRPGEVLRILLDFKEGGVDLLACSGGPGQGGRARIDFVPAHQESLRRAAARQRLHLGEPRPAFLVQEGDRLGALADVLAKLARNGINVEACQAVAAGSGRWGMLLWLRPEDHAKAAEAFGF